MKPYRALHLGYHSKRVFPSCLIYGQSFRQILLDSAQGTQKGWVSLIRFTSVSKLIIIIFVDQYDLKKGELEKIHHFLRFIKQNCKASLFNLK